MGQRVLCGNRCPWYSIIISREPSITRETRNLFTIPLVQFVAEAVNRFEISVPAAAQPFAEGEYSGAQFERLSIYLSNRHSAPAPGPRQKFQVSIGACSSLATLGPLNSRTSGGCCNGCRWFIYSSAPHTYVWRLIDSIRCCWCSTRPTACTRAY